MILVFCFLTVLTKNLQGQTTIEAPKPKKFYAFAGAAHVKQFDIVTEDDYFKKNSTAGLKYFLPANNNLSITKANNGVVVTLRKFSLIFDWCEKALDKL